MLNLKTSFHTKTILEPGFRKSDSKKLCSFLWGTSAPNIQLATLLTRRMGGDVAGLFYFEPPASAF